METEDIDNDSDGHGQSSIGRPRVTSGHREWNRLCVFDRTTMISADIDLVVLQLATDCMTRSGLVEWPSSLNIKTKRLSLWCQHDEYSRSKLQLIETYHCLLKGRCKCPCQISVITTLTSVQIDSSGGEHTQERCHTTDNSRFLNVKQRVAVAKLVKTNPSMAPIDILQAVGRSA
jgi:hypothetical protein